MKYYRRSSINLGEIRYALLIILGVIIILFLIITSDIFIIKKIYITANPEHVSDLSMFYSQQNYFIYNIQVLMDKIKAKYPSIKEVKVTKIFPDTLAIDLIERKPIAKLVIQDKTMLVDQDGYLFTDNILKPDQFWEIRCPVVDIPENKLTDQTILHGLRVLANIPQTANIPIEHLDCVESNTYSVQLSETKVLISDKRPADEVAASLLFLVKQFRIDGRWPVLVDLRFAKPVLKMTDTDAIIATASGTE